MIIFHFYLLDHYNCLIKSGYKVAISVIFWGAFENLLSQISTPVFSGIKLGKDGMLLYDITFSNLSRSSELLSDVTCVCGVHLMALDPSYSARALSSIIQY